MAKNNEKMNPVRENDVPRKRFAITIMGTAEYYKDSNKKFQDFQSWYDAYKEDIKKGLNGGIRIKSYMKNFELDNDIGQVQES